MHKIYIIFSALVSFLGAIDFDALEKTNNKSQSVPMKVHDADAANAKEFKVLRNKQKEVVNKFMSSVASSTSAVTSGNNAYKCSYHCRTDGLLSNATDTVKITINANTQYEAEDKLRDISKKHCSSMYRNGTFGKKWMWSTSRSCEK